MNKEAASIEKEAYVFLAEDKLEEAFKLFKQAAEIYKAEGNHKQAALCFTSAASCWNKKSGEKIFYNAALSYVEAAKQAEKSGDFEHASILYKHAAISHERDGESLDFSDCFYQSKECYRKFLAYQLINPGKIHSIAMGKETKGLFGLIGRVYSWIVLTLSFLVWGHGERPHRAFLSCIVVILLSAFGYIFGYLLSGNTLFRPHFFQALYFSVVTFTTVGYGDMTPIGLSRTIAMFESLSSIFIMPLFIISLSRKYLRI